jgi:hypothetical protein
MFTFPAQSILMSMSQQPPDCVWSWPTAEPFVVLLPLVVPEDVLFIWISRVEFNSACSDGGFTGRQSHPVLAKSATRGLQAGLGWDTAYGSALGGYNFRLSHTSRYTY